MEDDDIEYDITFPSPVSVPDDVEEDDDGNYLAKKEPVVILLGWLGCKEKHISKYSQIYDQRGCITITYTAPNDVAFFNHWKLTDIACKVLDLLEDYSVTDNPILFHIFSNNGSYVYRNIVEVLLSGDERYQKLQVYGVIIDSAPGKVRLLRAAKAYAASLHATGFKKVLLILGMMAYLFFTTLWAVIQARISSKYSEKNKHSLFNDLANQQSRWPEMYLYSKADKVIYHYDVEDMVERRKSLGIHVDSVCWESSDHVSHLRLYPERYRDACWEFLDFCLGTGQAAGGTSLTGENNQETSDEEYLLLLRAKAGGPLQTAEFLDLSNLGIVNIERISCCPKLQALNLRGNCLHEVSNLESNRHLWRLDLSNNKIQSLECLSKFVALGTLNLANNDLGWQEVGKLRHLRVLELSLHGNVQLEKDPYYRIHVIDCLPHIWMLDGRIITSAERLQVKHFFADSALTEHPIRHKLSKDWFVPSALKNIEVNGVYGDKATHLMMRFPANEASNIDSDRRRLKYLAYNAQEDLMVEKKATKRDFQVLKYRRSFVEDILDIQPADREKCNMLIVLLVATLEFIMPTHLVKETLETVKLSKLGKVYTMDLFLLPKDVRCRIVCILLGAVKTDKDAKEDGGLYDRLYLCLFYTVAELTKLCNSILAKNVIPSSKLSQTFLDYKCLLASEVVQLLCIVPAFFEYVDRDIGVMNLVVTATGDPAITDKIVKLSHNVLNAGGDVKKLYEELSDFLLQKVQEHSLNLTNRSQQLPREDQVFTSTKAFPMKSPRSPLDTSDYLAKGVSSPNRDPPSVLSARSMALKSRKHFPHLGDYLLLGPQTLGKVIGLPQPFVAHVAMDSIPVANGAMESKLKQSEDHYTYVNMDQMAWDLELGFWKPKGSIGDRFTIHTIEDLRKELNRRANLTTDQIPRPNSPEDHVRTFTGTPGRESTAPLIYSPGGYPPFPEEVSEQKSKPQDSPPRPMSSYLKEKLDLRLEFSPRRTQSASAVDRPNNQTVHSPKGQKELPERPVKSADTKKSFLSTEDSSESTGTLERVPSECVSCAIEKGLASETKSEADISIDTGAIEAEVQESQTQVEKDKKDVTEVPTAVVDSTRTEEEEDKGRLDTSRSARTEFADDFEPELQNLDTSRTVDTPAVMTNQTDINIKVHINGGSTSQPDVSDKTVADENSTLSLAKPNSSIQINIPQVEIVDAPPEKGDVSRRTKSQMSVGRRTPMSGRTAARTGKFMVDGKNRPFSAMDAYRYIIDHPRKPIGTDVYNTSYQHQRTEAWRQSAQSTLTSASSQPPRQGTPPPQRPSSPDGPKSRPVSALSIQRANNWLGGGRDLYWESVQKRPKSGHIPGWKEGLPESMKRPRSAVASRTLNRNSRRSTPVTPSSLAYEAMMQGSRGYSPRGYSPRSTSRNSTESPLPDLVDLSDYQPLYHHLSVPRQLGMAGPAAAGDSQGRQSQDTVYSLPLVAQPPQIAAVNPVRLRSPLCMQCILEDENSTDITSTSLVTDSHSQKT